LFIEFKDLDTIAGLWGFQYNELCLL